MHSATLTWVLALSGSVSASVLKRNSTSPTTSTSTKSTPAPASAAPAQASAAPCALASQAADAYLTANPKAAVAKIAPSLGYACLNSVPLDEERDAALLDYFEPYINWQSTLEDLVHPPKGYLIPGVDVLGGIEQIRAKLSQGGYSNQYQFISDFENLFVQAADGHFYYSPGLLSVFSFFGSVNLVSVSEDGIALPQLYIESDLVASLAQGRKASPIAQINGEDAVKYLEQLSIFENSQDPDAQYNSMFPTVPYLAVGEGQGFSELSFPSLPDETNVRFTNGSTYTITNYAYVLQSLTGIDTGAQLHSVYEIPQPTATVSESADATSSPTGAVRADDPVAADTTATASSTATATASDDADAPTPTSETVKGYPYPVVKHFHDYVAGYFLNATGYEDVAVLVLTAFEPVGPNAPANPNSTAEIAETQRVIKVFLAECAKQGKKKLVVDVSANGGGFIYSGYDAFAQLFPPRPDLWSGARLRDHPGLYALGQAAYQADGVEVIEDDLIGPSLSANGSAFPDWQSIYGPDLVEGQNLTNLFQYNFSVPPADGYYVTGFDPANPSQFSAPLFAAEDIVVLTDGFCASTCSIFVGLLTRQAGVRAIALGGRPLALPMQAIGGVKGSEVLTFSSVRDTATLLTTGLAEAAADNATTPGVRAASVTLEEYAAYLPPLGDPPLLPALASAGSFNFRSAFAEDAQAGWPLQFVYEAAHCRLFYTYQMASNVTAAWARVADVAWAGAKCVAGSTVNSDGTIGAKAPGFDARVESTVPAMDWPGSLIYSGPKMAMKKREVSLEEMAKGLKAPERRRREFKAGA